MTENAFPLAWPQGWPRTAPDLRRDSRHAFKSGGMPVSFDTARRKLLDNLALLRVTGVVLSTSIPLRQDGQPRADGYRDTMDPGVAVYFKRKDRGMVMAQDAYDRPSANIRSLGLAIEAMRQLERHGGGQMMEKAFAGFVALPRRKSCWEVLEIPPGSGEASIRAAHKGLVLDNQHDVKGGDVRLAELNGARDEALAEIRR